MPFLWQYSTAEMICQNLNLAADSDMRPYLAI